MEPTKDKKKKEGPRRTGQRVKLGRDKWRLRIFLGWDQAKHRRHYHTETFHGSATQAEDRIREIVRRHRTGEPIKVSSDTFGAFLDEWLETKRRGVSESTVKSYKNLIELYIRPTLGKLLLAQIRADAIQQLYSKLMAGKDGKSAGTVRHVHDLLIMAFKLAVLRKKLTGSPMAGVAPPRLEDDEKAKAMSVEQVQRFLDAIRGTRFEHLFRLAFHSGCRPGELLALKWDDLDAKAGTIRIDQSIVWRKAGDWYLKPPKTRKGRRTIMLTRGLLDILQLARTRQLEMRLQCGAGWKDHGFIFTTDRGEPWAQWHLLTDFKLALKRAGLPWDFYPYSTRHTAATMLMASDVHPKLVSDQLGHSRISITLDTYTHADLEMRSGLTAEIERLLEAKNEISNALSAKDSASGC